MAIDVTIRQTAALRELPLAVILGDDLAYGTLEGDSLARGTLGETDFIAYRPGCVGRGFSVVWHQGERMRVELRLPMPSTPLELSDFYHAIERIMGYWRAELTVDGERVTLTELLRGLDDRIMSNERMIRQISRDVLDGKHETLTLYAALWPLQLGKREASLFASNPEAFYRWLHEQQSVDALYASARFFQGEQGIVGVYVYTMGHAYLFPKQPYVPFGVTDPSTGRALACSDWRVWIFSCDAQEPMAELPFDEFLHRIPMDAKQDYNSGTWMIASLSDAQLAALLSR